MPHVIYIIEIDFICVELFDNFQTSAFICISVRFSMNRIFNLKENIIDLENVL